MDIEGGEYEVLESMISHDNQLLPLQVAFEIHTSGKSKGDIAQFMQHLYQKAGYYFIDQRPNPFCPRCTEVLISRLPASAAPYVCLAGELYGGLGNQMLALAWTQMYAKAKGKFVWVKSFETTLDYRRYLFQRWDQMFDTDAIPHLKLGGDDAQCAEHVTFENMYWDMLTQRERHPEMVLPVMKQEIVAQAMQNLPSVSIHGRGMDGSCLKYSPICKTEDSSVIAKDNTDNLCDYRQERVRALFNISAGSIITLFTDHQDPAYASTYQVTDSHDLAVQLWMMVLSPMHIGNTRSSMDYLISLWKHQLGLGHTMQPAWCYQ